MARVVTVNEVLDGHVALDIECLDRIYLNACVPILQTSSQVVAFLSGHLGRPFPSPVLLLQLSNPGGTANDPSTTPPADAISWRRLTSIAKSDLPASIMEAACERERTGSGRVRAPAPPPRRSIRLAEPEMNKI